jgi:alkaline phosphatase
MGITTITAARIYEGQLKGSNGEENSLSFESFPQVAFVKTYSADAQIPDSAATMTAIMSGQKTRAGVIGVGPKYPRGDCNAVLQDSAVSLLEMAEAAGFATGLVTTSRITDATPASTYAHAADRKWENDTALPSAAKQQGCTDMAEQLVAFKFGNGIDFIMGGGRSNFLPATQQDPEHAGIYGVRRDNRNLVKEWLEQREDRVFVWNDQQFQDVTGGAQVLGLFEPKGNAI